MLHTRGRIINGYLKFVKKKWGAEGVKAAVALTKEMDLTQVQGDKWYPIEYSDRIIEWMGKEHGMEAVRQSGLATATEIGVIKYLARIAGIKNVLERGHQELRENFDFGEARFETFDDHAKVHFKGVTRIKVSCVAWSGAFKGILEITGNKDGHVEEIECEHEGGKECVFKLIYKS